MKKPMWGAKAVKAYETGQGVELVNVPHPHYRPLPEDLNPNALETVEIELPQREWVELTKEDIVGLFPNAFLFNDCDYNTNKLIADVRRIEAKLKEKNT